MSGSSHRPPLRGDDASGVAGGRQETIPGAAAVHDSQASLPSVSFREIVESLPQLIWTCRPDGACDYLSPQWCQYTGKTEQEQLGYGWLSQIHPEDRERAAAEWKAASAAGRPHDTEFRILRHDGTSRRFRTKALPVRDAQGRVVKWFGTNTDVEDQRQTEQSLHRYELLASRTRDVILLVNPGDGRIQQANDSAVQSYGYTREELLALTIEDLRAPDDREPVREQLAGADNGGILFEARHRRKDGSSFPVEVSSINAEIGGVRSVVSVVRDISRRKAAEDQLRSVALFPQENPYPVLRVNHGGGLVYANPAAQDLVSEWESPPGTEVPGCIAGVVRAALDAGDVRHVELENRGRLFSFIVAPVTAQHYANLYGNDITASRRAERALAEAAGRQELLTEVVGRLLAAEEPQKVVDRLAAGVMRRLGCDIFVNYLLDPARGMLHLNACGGLSPEIARALEWLELGAAVCGCVALEGRSVVAEEIPSRPDPRTALVASLGIQAYACFPLIADGRTIGTLSFGARNRTRFSTEDLSLIEAVSQHISIALDRLHAREVIRRSEALYRTIARNIPDGGVWVVDRDLRYVQAEGPLAAELLSGVNVQGRLLSEVLTGPELAESEARFRKALAGESAGYEDAFGERVLWTQYVPLAGELGSVSFAMALTLDITERKRLEEQIRQSQKLESVGLLAGGVAHDFNNLLVGILGNASLAHELLSEDHAILPLLDSIVKAGEQAAHLTRQMLAYSGKGHFVIELLDLAEVVRDILPLARLSLSKRIEVDLDAPPALPRIEADRTQMQQVVTNLVINAGEAIGAGPGWISVSLGLRPGENGGPARVFLRVRDTGCGMDETVRSRVFDPFFSTKFTGRGLGLAAVHGIMRGHGGSIAVESAPGKGSTFTALFPVSDKEWTVRLQSAAPAPSLEGRATVLVVDDEPIVRDTARAAFKRFGYEAFFAENGWEALEILRRLKGRVSVVLLDLGMPGLDGEQTLPRLREIAPSVPVLVSSGLPESEVMRIFAGHQVAGFLQKPFTVRQLLSRIADAVARG